MKDIEALAQEALLLPLPERAELAERLLESLDGLSEKEIEALWAEEAERRVAAYRAGQVEAYPADDVHEEIRRRLG